MIRVLSDIGQIVWENKFDLYLKEREGEAKSSWPEAC
jgi:hypothetical protein